MDNWGKLSNRIACLENKVVHQHLYKEQRITVTINRLLFLFNTLGIIFSNQELFHFFVFYKGRPPRLAIKLYDHKGCKNFKSKTTIKSLEDQQEELNF